MKKEFYLLLVFSLFFSLNSCNDPDNKGNDDVSFNNFSSPSVIVTNNSDKKLIAFKNSVTQDNLISGVPANSLLHGLKKDLELFNKVEVIVLVFITEDEYKKNKSDLALADIFTKYFVYYIPDNIDFSQITVSDKLGGDGILKINNPTQWYIEIRMNGYSGEALGCVSPGETGMELHLKAPGIYTLYPVFKRYNSFLEAVVTVYPRYNTGNLMGTPYLFIAEIFSGKTFIFDMSLIAANLPSFSSGGFYLNVVNNSSTAVLLRRGNNVLSASGGSIYINPSSSNRFFINLTELPDGASPLEETISDFNLLFIHGFNIAINPYTFQSDFSYTLQINGNNTLDFNYKIDSGLIDNSF